MKRLQQLLWCYLALCLAGGSAVSLSPVLHRWVEHGGQAAAHSHFQGTTRPGADAQMHDHGDGGRHSHASMSPRPTGLFQHRHEPFGLGGISLASLWSKLGQCLEAATAANSTSGEDLPGHEHHGLFELLASGLLDQALDVPLLPLAPSAFITHEFPANTPFVVCEWHASTASRGPPSARG